MASSDPYMQNATFDPFTQDLVVLMPDGITPINIPMSLLLELQTTAARTSMIYGIQIGITALMLLVVLLMTKPEKRRNIVFISNVLALSLTFVRSIIQCVIIYGPTYNFYNWALLYMPMNEAERRNLRNLITAEALGFSVIVAMELSMLFQTFTVTNMLHTRYRTVTNIGCVLAASMTIAMRFVTMVLNSKWSILGRDTVTASQMRTLSKLLTAQNACIIASIVYFSAIFCVKLGQAIRKRRSIGLKQFGPIQVVFVMGCQTLFVPAMFGILSYWVLPHSPLNTMMYCVVVTFLPLSSIWASTKADGYNNIAAPAQWHDRRLTTNTRAQSEKDLLPSTVNTTLVDDSPRRRSFSRLGGKRTRHHTTASRSSIESEPANISHEGGIQIKSTYSIRSDHQSDGKPAHKAGGRSISSLELHDLC